MRLPSSPGYGGKSSPSASRPNFTHFTILAIVIPLANLQIPDVHQRLALVIVERLLLLRQVGDRAGAIAALDEPVRRLRRQHEERGQLELARPLLDLVHQRLAVAFA